MGDPGHAPASEEAKRGAFRDAPPAAVLLALALTALAVGQAWAPLLGLHLSGEDYTLLARIDRGLEASPHVFRPLLGLWLGGLHALFGVASGVPYHAGSLLVHLVNTALVFVLARRLFGSAWIAAACAALFGLGAGARDALYWVAAVNRPLSTFGALLALLGLLGLAERARGAALVACFGLCWQFATNEDFYGTALVVGGWCAWLALGRQGPEAARPVRGRALLVGGLALGLLAVHYLWIHRVPGGSEAVLGGVGRVLDSARTRSDAIVAGLGLPRALGLLLPIVGTLAIAAAGRPRAAAFAFTAWLGSFVPFVLSDAVGYRFYPTQAPLALLAGGLLLLFARAFPIGNALAALGYAALLAAVLFATRDERARGLARWRGALAEIEACEAPLRALAAAEPERAPVSVNIETTTMGLVYYLWPSIPEPSDVRYFGFLDAATGYVPPLGAPEPSQGTWFGRRLEGSFGVIEPARYFPRRPALEPFRLYRRVQTAASLDEARRWLCDPALDVTTTAVVEPGERRLALDDAANADASLTILEPFEVLVPNVSGRMRVAVTSGGDVVFAVQDGWLYDPMFRLPPDQQIFSGLREGRCYALEAVTERGKWLTTFPLNAYGLGVLVPAGEHVIEVRFRRRDPSELR